MRVVADRFHLLITVGVADGETNRPRQDRDVCATTNPTGAVLDAQSIGSGEGGQTCGGDLAKRTRRHKRHLLVDALGLVLVQWHRTKQRVELGDIPIDPPGRIIGEALSYPASEALRKLTTLRGGVQAGRGVVCAC